MHYNPNILHKLWNTHIICLFFCGKIPVITQYSWFFVPAERWENNAFPTRVGKTRFFITFFFLSFFYLVCRVFRTRWTLGVKTAILLLCSPLKLRNKIPQGLQNSTQELQNSKTCFSSLPRNFQLCFLSSSRSRVKTAILLLCSPHKKIKHDKKIHTFYILYAKCKCFFY